VLDGVVPLGGVAVSADGRQLVYSDCLARGPLLEVGGSAPATLAEAGRYGEIGAGPGGRVAYSKVTGEGVVLLLRDGGGATRELARIESGRFLQLSFSADGVQLAWVQAGGEAGIYAARIDRHQALEPMRVTSGATDATPVWLDDGRLAFTRRGDAGPLVHVVDLASGAEPILLLSQPREVWGRLPGGELFLISPDGELSYELDLGTGKSRKARVQAGSLGRPRYMATSSDGRWMILQLGEQGHRVYRADLTAARPELTLVWEAAGTQTLSRAGVTPEGHVVVAPMDWLGEIHVLEAPPGTPF
jgi:hypothetical protein